MGVLDVFSNKSLKLSEVLKIKVDGQEIMID